MTKIKVVDLDKLYNFVFFTIFPFEIIYYLKNYLNLLYFKIQILYSSMKLG